MKLFFYFLMILPINSYASPETRALEIAQSFIHKKWDYIESMLHPSMRSSEEVKVFHSSASYFLKGVESYEKLLFVPLDPSQERKSYDFMNSNIRIKPLARDGEQFFMVLLLKSQTEEFFLGAHLIKDKASHSEWLIGSLSLQKANYLGANAIGWFNKAKKSFKAGDLYKSYVFSRIAEKLQYTHTHIEREQKEDVELKERLKQELNITLKDSSFTSYDVLFGKDGPGLLVLFTFDDKKKTPQKNHCSELLTLMEKSVTLTGLFVGLRCAYRFPDELTGREGKLGSIWVASKSWIRTSL